MNKIEAYTTYLAEDELATLLFFGELIEDHKQQSFEWNSDQGESIMTRSGKEIPIGEFRGRIREIQALHSLGFAIYSNKKCPTHVSREVRHVTLLGVIKHRYKYERKNEYGKWWARLREKYKDHMAVIAFFVSIGLAIFETIKFFTNQP